jgi:hypothetical protein
MTLQAFLAFLGALLCGGLAAFIGFANPRAYMHWVFAAGMGALALTQMCAGLGAQAVFPADILRWTRFGLLTTAVVPGIWLLFSLCFARANSKEVIARWRWFVLLTFAFPFGLIACFPAALLIDTLHFETSSRWLIPVGRSGYVFHLWMLLSSVVILMNLERTLRVSTGIMRWHIKFMILGIASIFAVNIYINSQVILFSAINLQLNSIISSAIIVADSLIIISLIRYRQLNTDIYFSRTVLYNSITVFVVGIYLLTVGMFAKVISYFGGSQVLPLETFFVFLTAVGLAVLLLSDQLQQQIKQLISRHFYRSHYDYRQVWTTFTQRTTSVMDMQELCTVVANMASETFGVPAVTLWLSANQGQEGITLGGSTVFSQRNKPAWSEAEPSAMALVRYMRAHQMPVDFDKTLDTKAQGLKTTYPDAFRSARLRYVVPLTAGQQFLGLMTLDDRLTGEAFTLEDFALLKTLADQAAASLLNLHLSHRLLKAKEMEAFQTLSAFFVHDLKNLAAKLSLMVQNLPMHYDNPAFRDDMLRVISSSVAKMNAMCSRLSLVTKKIELHPVETDLNAVVRSTLAELQASLKVPLRHELHPVPQLLLDPEQIQKILVNLILNANEAIDTQGEIRVSTDWVDGWVVLTVSDNGCGMSKAFIERSLFQPFQTTKSHGLGIGLFHSKMIVEAHRGRVEVKSEAGKGSTFRILIPGFSRDCEPQTRLIG